MFVYSFYIVIFKKQGDYLRIAQQDGHRKIYLCFSCLDENGQIYA